MWAATGRSGYGDSIIGGDYDSWDGISPNGRQYKNEATMETRDLSGADYWHLRKQNRPTEEIPASLHMLNKDRANIDAYAQLDNPVKKPTKVPLKQRILPQSARLEKLNAEILELEKAYRSGEYSPEEYTLLRNVAFARKERAEVLYKKAINIQRSVEKDKEESTTDSYDNSPSVSDKEVNTKRRNSPQFSASNKGIVSIKVSRDLIYFLCSSVGVLILFTWLAH